MMFRGGRSSHTSDTWRPISPATEAEACHGALVDGFELWKISVELWTCSSQGLYLTSKVRPIKVLFFYPTFQRLKNSKSHRGDLVSTEFSLQFWDIYFTSKNRSHWPKKVERRMKWIGTKVVRSGRNIRADCDTCHKFNDVPSRQRQRNGLHKPNLLLHLTRFNVVNSIKKLFPEYSEI